MEETAKYEANDVIEIIGDETAKKIIETREPRGLFLCVENDKFIGIDNSTGDAWTEGFYHYKDCINWLWHGDKKAHEALEPMHFNYPRTKFVDSNLFFDQLGHVESELREIESAIYEHEQIMELFDLQHSVETAVRIAQEKRGVDVEAYRQKVIEKNRKRGYYDTSAGAKDKRGDIMTNYELIKNMSIEEMAVTIMCPNEMGMADIECDKSDECNCCECCLGWLQQEAGAEADNATAAIERIAGDRYSGMADKMARGE